MPRNRGRNATIDTVRSERNGRKGREGSRGNHSRQTANEVEELRGRTLIQAMQENPIRPPLLAWQSLRPGPERALDASDRSNSSGESPRSIKGQKHRSAPRAQDPDSSDGSSDTDTSSSTSDSSASSISPLPNPYNGTADQLVYDEWKRSVEFWAASNKFPRKVVMYYFPRLVTGDAESCFFTSVAPTRLSRKWRLENIFEAIHDGCFPPDYKLRVHRRLISAKQGNLKVVDFANKIFRLAKYVPYPINEEFLTTIFYEGLRGRIRGSLITAKSVPGKVDLKTMIRNAMNWEGAIQRAQAEAR